MSLTSPSGGGRSILAERVRLAGGPPDRRIVGATAAWYLQQVFDQGRWLAFPARLRQATDAGTGSLATQYNNRLEADAGNAARENYGARKGLCFGGAGLTACLPTLRVASWRQFPSCCWSP